MRGDGEVKVGIMRVCERGGGVAHLATPTTPTCSQVPHATHYPSGLTLKVFTGEVTQVTRTRTHTGKHAL